MQASHAAGLWPELRDTQRGLDEFGSRELVTNNAGGEQMSKALKNLFRLRQITVCLILAVYPAANGASAQTQGHFEGDLVLKALPDGRNMQLTQSFNYIDSHNVAWPVPSGTVVDGASIPSAFWSIIGAPYTGKYRDASVIHDYYCETHSRHWKAVHKVFYDGMLARGVNPLQAKMMYLAVYRFGPRWDYDADACFCEGCPSCANPKLKKVKSYAPKYKQNDFDVLKSKMADPGITLSELEDMADYQVNSEIFSK